MVAGGRCTTSRSCFTAALSLSDGLHIQFVVFGKHWRKERGGCGQKVKVQGESAASDWGVAAFGWLDLLALRHAVTPPLRLPQAAVLILLAAARLVWLRRRDDGRQGNCCSFGRSERSSPWAGPANDVLAASLQRPRRRLDAAGHHPPSSLQKSPERSPLAALALRDAGPGAGMRQGRTRTAVQDPDATTEAAAEHKDGAAAALEHPRRSTGGRASSRCTAETGEWQGGLVLVLKPVLPSQPCAVVGRATGGGLAPRRGSGAAATASGHCVGICEQCTAGGAGGGREACGVAFDLSQRRATRRYRNRVCVAVLDAAKSRLPGASSAPSSRICPIATGNITAASLPSRRRRRRRSRRRGTQHACSAPATHKQRLHSRSAQRRSVRRSVLA